MLYPPLLTCSRCRDRRTHRQRDTV